PYRAWSPTSAHFRPAKERVTRRYGKIASRHGFSGMTKRRTLHYGHDEYRCVPDLSKPPFVSLKGTKSARSARILQPLQFYDIVASAKISSTTPDNYSDDRGIVRCAPNCRFEFRTHPRINGISLLRTREQDFPR